MDNQDVSEYLLYLKENAAELRKFGKDCGMTDEEINSCIDDVLANKYNPPTKPSTKSVARKLWSWVCFGLKIWCGLLLIILGIFVMAWTVVKFHEPTESYLSKALQPYGYDIFRFVRLVTLPIHNIANITHYYDAECIIDNPFFKEADADCGDCKTTHKITEQYGLNATVFRRHLLRQKPIIFKRILKRNVSYSDLKAVYHKEAEILDSNVYSFDSTYSDIKGPRDLFLDGMEEEIIKRSNLVVKWKSRTVKSAQVLRKLFPRLEFIPPDSEVSLDKVILIDGPAAQHYELDSSFYPMIWYSQANGERKVILTPVDSCRASCDPLQVSVEQGDVLVYTSQMYKAAVLPNMKGISIGYQGSFSE